MDGRAYFEELIKRSDQPGPREEAIWKAVKSRNIVLDWVPIEYRTATGAKVLVFVSNDTLRVGSPGASVRVCTSQKLGQLIADELQCVLPTAMLSDVIWSKADLRLTPKPQRWYDPSKEDPLADGTMALTHRMLDYHEIIERQIAARSYRLLAGHHKDWINTPLLGTPGHVTMAGEGGKPAGCNYGWHGAGGRKALTMPNVSIVQPASTIHTWEHSDYSQQLRLVARTVYVCRGAAVAGLGSFTSTSGSAGPWPQPGSACTSGAGGNGTWEVSDIYQAMYDADLHPTVASENATYQLRHPALPWPSADSESTFGPPPVVSGTLGGGVTVDGGDIGKLTMIEKIGTIALGAFAGHLLLQAVRRASR